ncbi:MAG: hypothetical protein KDI71_15735 [Xanthomonadales bacterium]|nr:hypothetical protein [Xanthomonadales bacterium]
MATGFPSHGGLLRAHREGQILCVEGSGATNLEGAQAYLEALAPMVAELKGSRWAVLGVSDSEALLTPEAEQRMTAAAPTLTAMGRVAVAIVLPETPVGSIMRSQWSRVYADAGCALAFFDRIADATQWLMANLEGSASAP